MKVLITASTLPRWSEDSIPAFVLDQAAALARIYPKLDVHVLAPHHVGAARREEISGVTIHRFRYLWPDRLQQLAYPAILPNLRNRKTLYLQVPFLFLFEFLGIYRFCREHRPAVLYSHWMAPQALVGAAVARLMRIPHVFTSHYSDVRMMRRIPALGPVLLRAVVRRLHACSVVSRRTLDELRSFFSAAEWQRVAPKVRVIPMGVQIRSFPRETIADRDAARARLELGDRSAVLFLGRLTEKKGLSYLVEAIALMKEQRQGIVLLIAGDGELMGSLSREIDDMGLTTQIRLLGYVHGERKTDCLSAADVFVVPSIVTEDGEAEGMPVALLEGLAAGKICVATDVSGAGEILSHGHNGFVIPQRDANALAAAMSQALDLCPADRSGMSDQSRQLASQFDWGPIARAHYDHLLSAHGDDPPSSAGLNRRESVRGPA